MPLHEVCSLCLLEKAKSPEASTSLKPEPYLHNPKIHKLVTMIRNGIVEKQFTYAELAEAIEIAKTFTVRDAWLFNRDKL